MKLFIVRHGETKSNNEDLLQGQLDGTLSQKGIQQAEAMSSFFAEQKIDFIYSSDLKRSFDTAKIIAKPHHLTIEIAKEARERHFGIYQGTNRTAFYQKERSLDEPYNHRPENGESLADLYQRAESFLTKLINKHLSKTVVLVSHGDFARMGIGVLTRKSVADSAKIALHNACINIFEVEPNLQINVISIDGLTHLDSRLKSQNKSAL